MKRVIEIALAVLLLGFLSTTASAQNKTNAYYDSHPSEILPDAQAALRNGNYDRAVELCRLHFIIVGDSRADALKEKASQCSRLTIELNAYVTIGQQDAARGKAREILALNPDDRKARELVSAPKPSSSSSSSSGSSASVTSSTRGYINGHEWVDLGLPSGLKWATCNVGASSPEEYGDYYAWGETSPKSEYTWVNYRFRVSGDWEENVVFNKYNAKSKHGSVDNRTRLVYSDDAARANWGGNWRMPTDTEWTELRSQCTWTWTKQGGKNGYKVTSKINGNHIFLPAAGSQRDTSPFNVDMNGYYWSSALYTNYSYSAYGLSFSSAEVLRYNEFYRFIGRSVRPVIEW